MNPDQELQTAALAELTQAPNYQRWLASLALPHLGPRPLELGSGLGDYAAFWLDAGVPSMWLTEAEEHRLQSLSQRFAQDSRVSVGTLDEALASQERFTSLASYNVMEHVEDPTALLRRARHSLEPGARVMTFVPAFPFAMSRFDREIGHFRRYTKETLARELSAAGLTIHTLRYVNMPGLLAWTAGMRVLGLTPNDGPFLSLWDRWVVPATRRLEGGKSVPFGQSLWSIAVVNDAW